MPPKHRCSPGFSLIEIIAALVVIGIMAALLLPVTGTGLRSELDYRNRLQSSENLRLQMDTWLHQHRNPAATPNGEDLTEFRQYLLNSSLPDGVVIDSLDWITFDGAGGVSPGTESDFLMVTIRNEQSRLTTFFPPYHP